MRKIIGAAIGSCVHVGGLHHFLWLAESEGFTTRSLGPAVSPHRLAEVIAQEKPEMAAVSYRLTPDVAEKLFAELKIELMKLGVSGVRLLFGGPPPVADAARRSGLFERVFDGTESYNTIRDYLRGAASGVTDTVFPGTLTERIAGKQPYPLIRHHFGRPTMEETVAGVRSIALSGVVDVISIGPDQNAQEHFFHPEEMDRSQDGAGGVPLRSAGDLERIYSVSRCGNFPLVRCYAGTRDMVRWAEMSVATIHNAWAAIPLCWYSIIDGRSHRGIGEAVREHQQVMRWYAERDIPVEVNESHQWSLRDAHDSLAVAMAFLAAYNAKKAGVKEYVSQYMFNNPPGTTPEMDIAKMLAKDELIEGLSDSHFRIYREVRAGLAHFMSDPAFAQGQLAASAVVSLSMRPHILHVVGYSEGDHAITADELIHSCNIIHGVLHNVLSGMPDLTENSRVQERKRELMDEAAVLLEEIQNLGEGRSNDPWTDPEIIDRAVVSGLLDTPHFSGNSFLSGRVVTNLRDGAWYAINPETGKILKERERIQMVRDSWVH